MASSSFTNEAKQGRILGQSRNVFFLGVVSLLTDFSSEMIFTLIPLLLANVLGVKTTIIGLVGGLSESTDAIFRIFSGWFSDRIGKRKLLAVMGYSISTIAKPFMYIAASWGMVLGVRFSDRVGKGVRSSSRDALIADSISKKERGKSFGFHKAMDTSGAVLGLATAALITYLVQGGALQLSLETYQRIVIVGVIPAVLAVLVLAMLVREVKRKPPPGDFQDRTPLSRSLARLDTRFKVFLAIMAVFALGNSSDFFVILRAQNMGSSVFHVVLMLVVFNVTYAATSLPAGVLSDRLGRRRVITLGWFIYALVYVGFAVSSELWQVWLLFAGYGVYYGIVEGVARAFVADLVVEERRGTAYGLYHGVVGLALLPASLIAGWLWDSAGPASPFYLGAALAFLAMLGMLALIKE